MPTSTIKTLRQDAGMSQKTLAEQCGISQACISQYEKGIRKPTEENAGKIAQSLSCSVEKIVGSVELRKSRLWSIWKNLAARDMDNVIGFASFLEYKGGEK